MVGPERRVVAKHVDHEFGVGDMQIVVQFLDASQRPAAGRAIHDALANDGHLLPTLFPMRKIDQINGKYSQILFM